MKSASESSYNLYPPSAFPYLTLNEAAARLEISPQRLSRILRILEIPVHRRGYIIFLESSSLSQVKSAISQQHIKPGRKKITA